MAAMCEQVEPVDDRDVSTINKSMARLEIPLSSDDHGGVASLRRYTISIKDSLSSIHRGCPDAISEQMAPVDRVFAQSVSYRPKTAR